MNKEYYTSECHVQEFVNWFKKEKSNLVIDLDIKKSAFVPGGIKAEVKGFENVIDEYLWKTNGLEKGDWKENAYTLSNMSEELVGAISNEDEKTAFEACKEILKWGGNRKEKDGAWPFLFEKCKRNELCSYLLSTGKAFDSHESDSEMLVQPDGPVEYMNSMLTKVHSLSSKSGLPVYDSRVASAISSLVDIWRVREGINSVPAPLIFPAIDHRRSLSSVLKYPGEHGKIYRNTKIASKKWCSSKIRLSWLFDQMLSDDRWFIDQEKKEDGVGSAKHMLEASLFVIGYSSDSLARNLPAKSLSNVSG